jgi:hypothetical protein
MGELETLGFYDDVPADQRPAMIEKDVEAEWPFASGREYADIADAENIAEGSGGEWLREHRAALTKRGVVLKEIEDLADGEETAVMVNGRKFIILTNEEIVSGGATGWATAVERFVAMVNTLLEEAGSSERFYWISGGEDGFVAFLKPAVFEAITRARLLKPSDWPYPES